MTTSKNLQNFYATKQAGLAEYIKKLLAGGTLGALVGGGVGAGRGYFGDEANSAVEAAKAKFEDSQKATEIMQNIIDMGNKQQYGKDKAQHATDMEKYQQQIDEFNAQAEAEYKTEMNAANLNVSTAAGRRDREISHRERQLKSEMRDQSRKMVDALTRERQEMPEYRARLSEQSRQLDLSNPKDVKKHYEILDKLNESYAWDRDWLRHEPSHGGDSFQTTMDKNLQPWRDRLEDATATHDDDVAAAEALRDAITMNTEHGLEAPIAPSLKSVSVAPPALSDYEQMKLDVARNRGIQGMGLGALIGGGAGLGYQALNDLLFSGGPEPKYASAQLQHRTGGLMSILGDPVGPSSLRGSLGKLSSSYLQGDLYDTPEQG